MKMHFTTMERVLFTSVLPNLLIRDIGRALRETQAIRVLVGNLVSELEEAVGLEHEDHIRVLHEHVGGPVVDALLVHDGPAQPEVVERYRGEGASLLAAPSREIPGIDVFARNLIADGRKLRHEPVATAEGLLAAWQELSTRRQSAQIQRGIPETRVG